MKRIKFKLGLLLLIANFPIGYGGLAVTAAIAAKTGKSSLYLLAGGLYLISWLMMGAGIILAGPEGLKTARNLWKNIFRK